MQLKYGTHEDWRAKGWFVSFMFKLSALTLQIRPTYWTIHFIRPHGKPGTKRLYVGPLEIQYSNYKNNSQ